MLFSDKKIKSSLRRGTVNGKQCFPLLLATLTYQFLSIICCLCFLPQIFITLKIQISIFWVVTLFGDTLHSVAT